jgi:hypothetical protein
MTEEEYSEFWTKLNEEEQKTSIRTRKYPRDFFERKWDTLTSSQQLQVVRWQFSEANINFVTQYWAIFHGNIKNEICKRLKLPPELIARRWWRMRDATRKNCFRYQKVPSSIIREYWEKMSQDLKECCLRFQKLPLQFIKKYWSRMSYNLQNICLSYQELSVEFIESIWSVLATGQRDCCCIYQKLSVEFISSKWYEFTIYQQNRCVGDQKYLYRLPAEMLPQFLTDKSKFIRSKAKEAMEAR